MKTFDPLSRYLSHMGDCSACGLCVAACPVFAQSGLEPDGPRGKLELAVALARNEIKPEDASGPLSHCLLCGKCARACPRQLPITEIFLACRQKLAGRLPLSPKRKQFFRALARWPKFWDFIQAPLAIMQRLGKRQRKDSGAWQNIAVEPLNAHLPEEDADTGSHAKIKVLLFTGCLVRRIFPEVGLAAIAALEQNGMQVSVLPELVCCGRPLAVQGENPGAAVRKNLAVLSRYNFKWVVTPCPACLATLKTIWPSLDCITDAEREQAKQLAAQCIDISALLPGRTHLDPSRKIFWHRPCLLEDASESRIKSSLGIKTQGPAKCCGAPTFCLDQGIASQSQNQMQRLLGSPRQTLDRALAKNIRSDASGADCIVTACPGCMLALGKATNKPVRHVVEFLWRS